LRTRVGYAGGAYPNPTYHDIGDHSESIQVDFDPAVVPYGRLLDLFWESHDPARPAWSRQYASLIFVHSPVQEKEAEESRNRLASAFDRPLVTEIHPYTGFTRAEEYHQKFRLRRDPVLMKAFRELFPEERSFVDSTAAARVNGFLSGFGDPADYCGETPLWGLSAEAWKILRRVAEGRL
jgi:peptide-methionine (S)-S-oxide reductase